MAQSIQIAGASYQDVPSILVPKVGTGTAIFADPSGTTATASDVAVGKFFLSAAGVLTEGTSSGGGASPWTLINSQEHFVNTTSTSASTAVTIAGGSAISTAEKIVWVHIRDKAGARAGYFFGSDAFFINYNRGSGSTTTFAVPAALCLRYNNGAYSGTVGQYGVYGYSISSTGSLIVRRRYNATYTLTINGTYKIDVYTLDLPSGITLFD